MDQNGKGSGRRGGASRGEWNRGDRGDARPARGGERSYNGKRAGEARGYGRDFAGEKREYTYAGKRAGEARGYGKDFAGEKRERTYAGKRAGEARGYGRDFAGEKRERTYDGKRAGEVRGYGKDFAGEKREHSYDGKRAGEAHGCGKDFAGEKREHTYDGKRAGEARGYGKDFAGEKREHTYAGKRAGETRGYGRDFAGEKRGDAGRFAHGGARGADRPAQKREFRAKELSARDVALRAVQNVARDNAYAAQALDRELSAAQLSPEDRRLAASLFYFTLENRLRLMRLVSQRVKMQPEPEIMNILCLAAAQILYMDKIPDHAAVDEAVEQTRRAGRERMTSLVNAVLRGLIRDRDAGAIALPDRALEPEKYISEKYSVALPLVERIAAAYGVDTAEAIAAWTPDRHSDSIRPNRLQMTDGAFETWLDENQLKWAHGSVPGAYRVSGAGRLAAHEGYRRGIFSIQGESSMLAAYALEAKPGMQVLDACAAPGGKSCLIAEMMRGTGRVYAWDLHEHRVELIRAAARRLGLDNIRPQARDAAQKNASMAESMDAVLVDAPCSGLGVMGDKPDIKYRLTVETIEALLPIQRAILETCASYVRPGGLLVYSTCTILPEENQAQVAEFLQAHPEFEADNDARWLPEAFRDRLKDGMVQLLPCRDGVDGFFIARLRRKADAHVG